MISRSECTSLWCWPPSAGKQHGAQSISMHPVALEPTAEGGRRHTEAHSLREEVGA